MGTLGEQQAGRREQRQSSQEKMQPCCGCSPPGAIYVHAFLQCTQVSLAQIVSSAMLSIRLLNFALAQTILDIRLGSW
jgi:hypothetical protein